jgi:hypothetical protein
MIEIIKTNDGYMVQHTDGELEGEYLCDTRGDNLWDTYAEAEAVFWGREGITYDNWKLVSKDGKPVNRGDKAISHRNEEYIITGGRPPLHMGSTGRVWVEGGGEYFPTVFDLKWEEVK